MQYNLEERTTRFAESLIDFIRTLPVNSITKPIINQLIRSGTSIGANYHEANEASSSKDFRNKIFISKKESSETKHWLRLIARAIPEKENIAKMLWKEVHEFTLIFAKITRTLDTNQKKIKH